MTWLVDGDDSPTVVRKTFPATVQLPDGTEHRLALVITTLHGLYVWTSPGDPTLTLALGGASVGEGTVRAGDGREVTWSAQGGCGCSHPLKRYRPFSGAARSHG